MPELRRTPVQVYYPRDPKDLRTLASRKAGSKPYKSLTARTQDELAALLRIGWTLEPPKEGK